MNKCENCKYGKLDEKNKARIRIICAYKNKLYYYGQRIECDNYTKREAE